MPRRFGRLVLLASLCAWASVAGACSLFVSTTGLDDGPPPPASEGGTETGDESLPRETSTPEGGALLDVGAPVDIASAGLAESATGMAHQTRMLHAAGRYWFFYVSTVYPTSVRTRWSIDFVSWQDGPPLEMGLAHGGDGTNLSVASRTIAGSDVLHVAYGARTDPATLLHARGLVAPTTITSSTPITLNTFSANQSVDEPLVAITGDGTVVYASSWGVDPPDSGYGGSVDSYAWVSTEPDPGGSGWAAQFGPQTLIGYVNNGCNARALIPLAGGSVAAFWENGSAEPSPSGVDFTFGGRPGWRLWSPVVALDQQHTNDWAVVARTDSDIHFVRRSTSGAFLHRRYDSVQWADGPTIAAEPGATGSGIVAATDGANVSVYAIAPDGAIRTTRWNGSTWGAWSTIVPGGTPRLYLSKAELGGQVALVWTQRVAGESHAFAFPVTP